MQVPIRFEDYQEQNQLENWYIYQQIVFMVNWW